MEIGRILIVKRAINLRLEILQLFADAEHWNNGHPTIRPINIDPAGELKKLLGRLDAIIETNCT